MATRIFTLLATLGAGDQNTELTGSPLSPPSGIKWTIVELRVENAMDSHVDGYFDTEKYHTIYQEDVNQHSQPHVVALDVVQPHAYHVFASDDSGGGGDVKVTIVVEESPQTGA
jgi:hypothetical protein